MTNQELHVLTVTQLTNAIKLCLESTFPSVWLQGEISNFKPHSSGHLYFSLKDANSQITAVMWRQEALNLKITPKDGMQVLVRGALNVYPNRGNYQIVVSEMKPVGLGELLLKLEELKQKIYQLGWFKREHKKALPKYPKRIGIVTSPTGAAIQDILHVLSRRAGGLHILLNPVKVQGDGSAQEIAKAIDFFNEHNLVDVMIVGRGGGSIEDLWAFNEEIVAAAIFRSQIPIISAVGHETDHCIADYVADVRAPTPSAAAEIVIADKLEQLNHLDQLKRRLRQAIFHKVSNCRKELDSIRKQPVFSSPYFILGPWIQFVDESLLKLNSLMQNILHKKLVYLDSAKKQIQSLQPSNKIRHMQDRLKSLEKALDFRVNQLILAHKEQLLRVSSSIGLINPKNLLTKGYSILFSEKDRSVITSVHNVDKNQDLRIVLSDGDIISIVKDIVSRE